jgi:hypothetical protein
MNVQANVQAKVQAKTASADVASLVVGTRLQITVASHPKSIYGRRTLRDLWRHRTPKFASTMHYPNRVPPRGKVFGIVASRDVLAKLATISSALSIAVV